MDNAATHDNVEPSSSSSSSHPPTFLFLTSSSNKQPVFSTSVPKLSSVGNAATKAKTFVFGENRSSTTSLPLSWSVAKGGPRKRRERKRQEGDKKPSPSTFLFLSAPPQSFAASSGVYSATACHSASQRPLNTTTTARNRPRNASICTCPRPVLSDEARRSTLYRDLACVVPSRRHMTTKTTSKTRSYRCHFAALGLSSPSPPSVEIVRHFLFNIYEPHEKKKTSGGPKDGTEHRNQHRTNPQHRKREAKAFHQTAMRMRNPRDFASGRDSWGRTPLHIAALHGAHVKAIRLLLQVYPEAAHQKDGCHRIPLHSALYGVGKTSRRVNLSLVQALLQAHPASAFEDAATTGSMKGWVARGGAGMSYRKAAAVPAFPDDEWLGTFSIGTSAGKLTSLVSTTTFQNSKLSDGKETDDGIKGNKEAGSADHAKGEETRNHTQMEHKLETENGNKPDDEQGKGKEEEKEGCCDPSSGTDRDSNQQEVETGGDSKDYAQRGGETDDGKEGTVGKESDDPEKADVTASGSANIDPSGNKESVCEKDTSAEAVENRSILGNKTIPGKNSSLLHLAASRCCLCEPGVLETILCANPRAALEHDQKGRTPLHILLASTSALPPFAVMKSASMMGFLRWILGRRQKDGALSSSLVDAKEVAAMQDANGRTLLHLAVNHGVDMKIVQMLLDAHPQAASMQDIAGDTPLHMAFRGLAVSVDGEPQETVPKKLVEAIVRACPESAKVLSKDRLTPLHLACSRRDHCEDGVIELILDAHPQAVLQRDNNHGKPLLHTLISELRVQDDANASNIMFLIRELLLAAGPKENHDNANKNRVSPRELAATADSDGSEPLHLAVQQFAREEFAEVISLLLDIYPEAASHKDQEGHFPIQLLLLAPLRRPCNRRFRRSVTDISAENQLIPSEIILALLKTHPTAAAEEAGYPTIDGSIEKKQTLLHLIAMKAANYNVEIFDAIQVANPSAALRADSLGRTPLHCFISNSLFDALRKAAGGDAKQLQEAMEKTKILLRPAETRVRTEQKQGDGTGDTQTTWATVKTTAAAAKDNEGRTPLHALARLNGPCPRELVATVLEACPLAAKSRDELGRLPLSLSLVRTALMSRAPAAFSYMLKELVMAYPAAVLEKVPETSTTVLRLFLSSGLPVDNLIPLATLEEVLKSHTDSDGTSESLLHVAARTVPHCKVETLDIIQRSDPSAVLSTNSEGETPLHCFIRQAQVLDGQTQEKMMVLLRTAQPENPDDNNDDNAPPTKVATTAAAVRDQKGTTPLHTLLCCHKSCSKEIVLRLMEAWPDAASMVDESGRFPLTLALTKAKRPIEYLKELLDACPAAIKEAGENESTGLHHLLGSPCSIVELESFLEVYPEAVSKLDKSGVTPLQNALFAWLRSSHDELGVIVKFMAEKYPHSVTTRHRNNQSTLHIALQLTLPPAIIETVLKVDPEAAAALWESDMSTPLSTAAGSWDNSADICKLLLMHCPRSAHTLLDDDTTALHHVQSWETVKILLDAWPEALQHRSRELGRTPMHFWMMGNVPCDDEETSGLLYVKQHSKEKFMDAVRATDNLGLTPLHYAFGEYSIGGYLIGDSVESALEDPDVVFLLSAYPDVLFLRVPKAEGKTEEEDVVRAGDASESEDNDDDDDDGDVGDGDGTEDDDGENGDGDDEDNDADDESEEIEDEDDGSSDRYPIEGIAGSSIVEKLCEFDSGAESLELVFEKLCTTSESPSFGEDSSPTSGRQFPNSQSKSQNDSNENTAQGGDDLAVWFLHKACQHASGSSGMIRLIRKCHSRNGKCVRSRSESGDLPLHIACHHTNCCLEVVQELTELYGAALTMDGSTGHVPFVLACLNDASVDVTYHLLRSAPDIIFG